MERPGLLETPAFLTLFDDDGCRLIYDLSDNEVPCTRLTARLTFSFAFSYEQARESLGWWSLRINEKILGHSERGGPHWPPSSPP